VRSILSTLSGARHAFLCRRSYSRRILSSAPLFCFRVLLFSLMPFRFYDSRWLHPRQFRSIGVPRRCRPRCVTRSVNRGSPLELFSEGRDQIRGLSKFREGRLFESPIARQVCSCQNSRPASTRGEGDEDPFRCMECVDGIRSFRSFDQELKGVNSLNPLIGCIVALFQRKYPGDRCEKQQSLERGFSTVQIGCPDCKNTTSLAQLSESLNCHTPAGQRRYWQCPLSAQVTF
jgi:hypothetical protein